LNGLLATSPRSKPKALDAANGGFSLAPPAERGEKVGERGMQRLPGVAASSPQPSPPKEEREIEPSVGGSVKRPKAELLSLFR
jgi:hypothetical protein